VRKRSENLKSPHQNQLCREFYWWLGRLTKAVTIAEVSNFFEILKVVQYEMDAVSSCCRGGFIEISFEGFVTGNGRTRQLFWRKWED
jgi:hypothetical protein